MQPVIWPEPSAVVVTIDYATKTVLHEFFQGHQALRRARARRDELKQKFPLQSHRTDGNEHAVLFYYAALDEIDLI